MGENLWEQIENEFLYSIYKMGGAIEVKQFLRLQEYSSELKINISEEVLKRLVNKKDCVVEKIRKLDNIEEEIVFITLNGVDRILDKKSISVNKIFEKQIAYELKCEGCASYSEWLETHREKLILEKEITGVYARTHVDVEILLTCLDDEKEIEEYLQEAIEKTQKRVNRNPEFKNTIAYAVVMAIYTKLLELFGTDKLFEEAESAKKLLEAYMPQRHKIDISFI